MVLRGLTSKPATRRIIAYDLEWYPRKPRIPKELWLKLRLVGVFDGEEYRTYTSVSAFLCEEMTPENSGAWFYAHAGGLADILFLLPILRDSRYQVEMSFSGSSAIIVRISDGRDHWILIDSLWTLRSSLADIGEAIGLPKGDVEWDCPLPELIAYNERDCRIVYAALTQFEDLLHSLGSELKATLASTSMALFRRRYLSKDLVTSIPANDKLRQAYFGGKVVVYQRYAERGFCYDINSSFPFAMLSPLPGRLLRTISERGLNRPRLPEGQQYFADVTVRIARDICPLPKRSGGSLYFPVGEWRGWYSGDEIALLDSHEIARVHEVMLYDARLDLATFAQELYDRRKAATYEFHSILLKYLLNSGYGKFGEREEKSSVILNPGPEIWEKVHSGELVVTGNPFPGCLCFDRSVELQHVHVPFAAAITARARANLHRFELQCDPVLYCDTDSVCTPTVLPVSKELGELKREYSFSPELGGAEFVAGKLYRLGSKVRAKGFPLERIVKEAYDRGKGSSELYEDFACKSKVSMFDTIKEGGDIKYARMLRVRESIVGGHLDPTEIDTKKHLAFKARPKRKTFPDGHTEPWNVSELGD